VRGVVLFCGVAGRLNYVVGLSTLDGCVPAVVEFRILPFVEMLLIVIVVEVGKRSSLELENQPLSSLA
jgi:hypothetical protein